MFITVPKEPLEFLDHVEGPPKSPLKPGRVIRGYEHSDDSTPFKIESVNIASKTGESKKFIECELYSDNMQIPDTACWFVVEVKYNWRIATGRQDSDTIVTDGDNFYLARRDLGKSQFHLNNFTRDLIISEIQRFAGVVK